MAALNIRIARSDRDAFKRFVEHIGISQRHLITQLLLEFRFSAEQNQEKALPSTSKGRLPIDSESVILNVDVEDHILEAFKSHCALLDSNPSIVLRDLIVQQIDKAYPEVARKGTPAPFLRPGETAINIRVDALDRDALKAAATAAGLRMPDYLRGLITTYLSNEHPLADHEVITPTIINLRMPKELRDQVNTAAEEKPIHASTLLRQIFIGHLIGRNR